MVEVENGSGIGRGCGHLPPIGIEEGGRNAASVAVLPPIDAHFGVYEQPVVGRFSHRRHRFRAYGDIREGDVGGVKEGHIALYATETPEVLVLEIAAVAVFIHLYGNEIFTWFEIWGDVEFGCVERTLTVADGLTVDPDVECRHHTVEAEEGLACGPRGGEGEPPAVLTRRRPLNECCPSVFRF